ncbi:YndM family protein [Priestia flexa]|uniref:YndM family protein n=1 Tax=Priestia flexa TaxID=86664 RepID=A0A8I1MFC1_9BACI|nr:YndM family protein [Priestia flexa]MBN8251341.1 YndM family protein [Priestia flexa]
MKHISIIIVKFISCMIAFAIGLDLFFDATFVDILSFSAFVTAASYILGDRIILPALGNKAATAFDFILAYMSVWIFGTILLNNYMQIAWGSILSATIITGVEVLVHRYSLAHFFQNRTRTVKRTEFRKGFAYGTEFAEEHDSDIHNPQKK